MRNRTLFLLTLALCHAADLSATCFSSRVQSIPAIGAINLHDVELQLPEAYKGKITLAIIAFDRAASDSVLSWSKPLHALYDKDPDIQVRQLALLGPVNSFTRWIVDTGLKTNIEKRFYHSVNVCYEPTGAWKEYLRFSKPSDCYVLVLDAHGHVVGEYTGQGSADAMSHLQVLVELVRCCGK